MPRAEPHVSPIGRLLKRWRGIRGLSQLDLALACDVSARHLSFLETGRAEPSRAMVLRLADALDVPLAERNALLVAAGYAPLHPRRALESDALARVRAVLRRLLDNHDPYPAVALDGCYNVLLVNASLIKMFAFLGFDPSAGGAEASARTAARSEDAPPEGPNLFFAIFDPAGLRPYIVDWEDAARTALRRAHREDAARGGDPGLQRLIRQVTRLPGVPADRLRSAPVSEEIPCLTFTLAHGGRRLTWLSTITTFGTPQDVTVQGLSIESFFPADDETEQLWRAL